MHVAIAAWLVEESPNVRSRTASKEGRRRGIAEHEYEHAEKMETDNDLAPLQKDPRFSALFRDWRTRRADLN